MSADEIRALAQQACLDRIANKVEGESHHERAMHCSMYAKALLAYAAMVERCEALVEELGKCKSHHTGVCPAYEGEIVSYWNCPKDKPCAKAFVIKELRALLRSDEGKEEK